MDFRLALVIIALLAFAGTVVDADIYYDRLAPKLNDTEKWGFKCIPGRSYIKIGGDSKKNKKALEEESSEEEGRRTHMNSGIEEESCVICLCSVDGTEKHCVGRPARNVNECIRMGMLKKEMEKGLPYAHDRILAYRIRRDYIWHYDEIPYDSKAKCERGVTYYSNNVNANDTDIDVQSDIESLLSYNTTDICFYCVCSVDGKMAGCISRDPWYCEYYRMLKAPNYARDRYTNYFRQDRPAYFRTLSYRMRRRMDDGVFALLDIVGSDSKCIPFVSEYSDCSDANSCSGCNKCTCDKNGDWRCQKVVHCPVNDDEDDEDNEEITMEVALESLLHELQEESKNKRYAPPPPIITEDTVLDNKKYDDYVSYPKRRRRSLDDNSNKNHTIKFFNTVDEINEDTLKNSNKTGTVKANKFIAEIVPKTSRRSSSKESKTNQGFNKLRIEPNQQQEYNHHSAENKIDVADDKKIGAVDKNILKILGNYSQDKKDTDVSKLVANELKTGIEKIGEKGMNPVSNITFTPENDTLTAMAFIAGNLLNKLWDMEKYAGQRSIEADVVKHEKISDLLDLFKEPLSIRQETFLKNALEKLSQSLDRNKNAKNMTICENFENIVNDDNNKNNSTNVTENAKCVEATTTAPLKEHQSLNMTKAVLSKLNNVLNLINDFENVQNDINRIKEKPWVTKLPNNDLSSRDTLDTFGNILNKISKLLIPNHYKTKNYKTNNTHYLRDQNDIKLTDKNIHINDMNITVKDKIILDYIAHIENNPSCLNKNKLQTPIHNKSRFKVEGNILNVISQFLDIENFKDLLNTLNLEIKQEVTTENIVRTDNIVLKANPEDIISSEKAQSKLQIVKKKLKKHLKAIIDDLIDLQSEDANGEEIKNINIAQALPCIYNILNDKHLLPNTMNKTKTSSLNKIKSLIDSLKLDFQVKKVTRRKLTPSVSSQSAKVFERVIKNINRQLNQKSRRNFNTLKPKSYEQIKNMISRIENIANSYKKFALLSNVSPKNRLMLLKALEADVKQHENILTSIHSSLAIISNLPRDKRMEIEEFVESSKRNIDLSERVIQNILENKVPNKETLAEEIKDEKKVTINKNKYKLPASQYHEDREEPFPNTDLKVTKDTIINQLMVNRVNAYIQAKEATESNPSNDMKYNIAENILSQIKSGNIELAKELFKIFLSAKDRESIEKQTDIIQVEQKPQIKFANRRSPLILALKEPLIAIKAKDPRGQAQDSLLKQLINLESI